MREHETYLGDGLYAYVEHGSLWLSAPVADGSERKVCLEAEVYEALVRYVDRLRREARNEEA